MENNNRKTSIHILLVSLLTFSSLFGCGRGGPRDCAAACPSILVTGGIGLIAFIIFYSATTDTPVRPLDACYQLKIKLNEKSSVVEPTCREINPVVLAYEIPACRWPIELSSSQLPSCGNYTKCFSDAETLNAAKKICDDMKPQSTDFKKQTTKEERYRIKMEQFKQNRTSKK
jgi:hypothetical protein